MLAGQRNDPRSQAQGTGTEWRAEATSPRGRHGYASSTNASVSAMLAGQRNDPRSRAQGTGPEWRAEATSPRAGATVRPCSPAEAPSSISSSCLPGNTVILEAMRRGRGRSGEQRRRVRARAPRFRPCSPVEAPSSISSSGEIKCCRAERSVRGKLADAITACPSHGHQIKSKTADSVCVGVAEVRVSA